MVLGQRVVQPQICLRREVAPDTEPAIADGGVGIGEGPVGGGFRTPQFTDRQLCSDLREILKKRSAVRGHLEDAWTGSVAKHRLPVKHWRAGDEVTPELDILRVDIGQQGSLRSLTLAQVLW